MMAGMYIYAAFVCLTLREANATGSPGTGVTSGCELSDGLLGSELGLSPEHQAL